MIRAMSNLALFCALLGVLACGDDTGTNPDVDPGDGKPSAELVGRWTFQSVTVDGSASTLASVLDWVANAVAANVQIQAIGSYVYEEVAANGGQLWFESGFVFVDGSSIDINAQLDNDGPRNETTRYALAQSGETLTLQTVAASATTVFTLTKGLATIQAYAAADDASHLFLRDLTEIGILGAVSNNLGLYRTAVAAAAGFADLAALQSAIDNVNGLAVALQFDQGLGISDVPIEANGVRWFFFVNGFPNHQISATTVDDLDLRLDIFYPGYTGVEAPAFSIDENGPGANVTELHNTNTTEPLPNGTVYLRVTELSGNAGLFNIFDSD